MRSQLAASVPLSSDCFRLPHHAKRVQTNLQAFNVPDTKPLLLATRGQMGSIYLRTIRKSLHFSHSLLYEFSMKSTTSRA